MKVAFGQQTTKVKQLADLISQDISMGKYKVENALPSINRLSQDYKVSRDTVFKAFIDLKERGIIDSTPGKGYFVVNRQKNILLLLDEYSPFKDTLYNSFVKRLSTKYKVDLWFHQYNESLFNTIIRDSIGRYNKYVVMNFDNEKFSPYLYKIDPSRLLLLDFGKFDKREYSYICQDFGEYFYRAMSQLSARIQHYQKLVLCIAKGSKHPEETSEYFKRYCMDCHVDYSVMENMDELEVRPGEVYIAVRQVDVVEIVKKSRIAGLTCGMDFGLIAYNDTPAYEVIDKGITAMSIDWRKMGAMTADFILSGKRIQVYLPIEIHLRGSL
ncbi:GntR family transcriptional regulator [Bacteroides fluxus]|jgi:DNA-binding transcriptional regulator YhcF (GntR family)|uniref:Transcriptional regulator, GntR family n=1 Tax=Bacteroides fluxus YIT 12057 TaxID=763034 RepID=F3PQ11_9BACE|nr:GntR family transcriptional regulator [Bacteroides fluxus]EGF59053.1 transcriptional regulator, GntR family [Bacteroides fluxus YIT 12057]MDY3790694.1 GntR family transcriptional regulator [Bacteroides fluxus]